jgi:hypothetical protein
VWCSVVWCGVVWCGVVWCGVVWCGVVWCGVVWCGVVWCGVVRCGVVRCGVVRCGVVVLRARPTPRGVGCVSQRGRPSAKRSNLKKLLTPKVWLNAAGFVRLRDSDFQEYSSMFPHPLEFTRIHPEHYSKAVEVRRRC